MNTNFSFLKQFKSCPKMFNGSLDKCRPPAETVAHIKETLPLLAPGKELVSLKRQAVINASYSFKTSFDGFAASGKGLEEAQAEASGLMELTERLSWLNFAYKEAPGYRLASYNELAQEGIPLVDKDYFLANLRDKEAFAHLLPEILALPQKWITAQNLTTSTQLPYPITWHNMIYTSNGLAAGNRLPEALVQAVCEVIERENVCRLFIDERPPRLVDQASIDDPDLLRILNTAREAGIDLTILEIGADLGIPTFCVAGVISEKSDSVISKGVGQGCHLNPKMALIRALTEYFESLSIKQKEFAECGPAFEKIATNLPQNHSGFLATYNRRMLSAYQETIAFDSLPNKAGDDFCADLLYLVETLAQAGYEVSYMDITHPLLKVPAVRVFVPFMRTMISGAIYTPTMAIAQCLAESGNYEAAISHFYNYIQEDPVQQKIFSSPMMMMSIAGGKKHPEKIFSRDFQDYYLKSTKFKDKAAKLFSLLSPLVEAELGL